MATISTQSQPTSQNRAIEEFRLRTEIVTAARALLVVDVTNRRKHRRCVMLCNSAKWRYAEFLSGGDYSRISEFTPIAQAVHNEVRAEFDALQEKNTATL